MQLILNVNAIKQTDDASLLDSFSALDYVLYVHKCADGDKGACGCAQMADLWNALLDEIKLRKLTYEPPKYDYTIEQAERLARMCDALGANISHVLEDEGGFYINTAWENGYRKLYLPV